MILDRNYKIERPEIDLVCFEPNADNSGGELVFVEVKTRRGSDWGTPEESVTSAQKQRIMRAAEAFMYERKLDGSPCRFDVVAIEKGAGDAFELRHHRHAFRLISSETRFMIRRIRTIIRREGDRVWRAAQSLRFYRLGTRPLPTQRHVRYADVEVAYEWKYGDSAVPRRWRPAEVEDVPEYEAALIGGIAAHVRPGDRVVVVGGGAGVTVAIAAQRAGPTGHVTCFEGGRQSAAAVRRTAQINGVADRLTVEHAHRRPRSVAVFGDAPDRAVVAPDTCCPIATCSSSTARAPKSTSCPLWSFAPAGAARRNTRFWRRADSNIRNLLESLGYDVKDRGVAEPRARAFCEENDIRVLEGIRRGDKGQTYLRAEQ